MAKMYDEKKPALLVDASYRDFDGDLGRWKESFYTLWRYQLTWDFAYKLEIRENRSDGVFVRMVINSKYKEPLLDTMDELGYKKIGVSETEVGFVWAFEHDELENIEELVLDY